MITWWIVGRSKPGMTRERYFYEWGIVHTALMLTTPSVAKAFTRYVQNYGLEGVSDDVLRHPQSADGWESIGVHYLEDIDRLFDAFAPDYVERLQPHSFGDSAFVIEFTGDPDVVMDSAAVPVDGALKVVNFLRRRAGMSQDEFTRIWREEHAPLVLRHAVDAGLVTRYVQNPTAVLDVDLFKGSLFERADVGGYGGVEELWGPDLGRLAQLRTDPVIDAALSESEARFVDRDASFSLVVVEREPFTSTHDEAEGSSTCVALGGLRITSRPGTWITYPPVPGAPAAVPPGPAGAP